MIWDIDNYKQSIEQKKQYDIDNYEMQTFLGLLSFSFKEAAFIVTNSNYIS